MPTEEFKTGQQVLVRRPDTNWCVDIYSYNDGAIVAKHEFNKTRPYKHGKEF